MPSFIFLSTDSQCLIASTICFFVYRFFIAICIYDNLNHEEFDAFVFQLQDDLDQMSGFQGAYNIFHV